MHDASTPLMEAFISRRSDLHALFRARTRSHADADDLIQDLFVKIVSIDGQQIENPGAYIYKLAMNLVIDRQRQRVRSARRDDAWRQINLRAVGEEFAVDEPTPEDAAAQKQRLALVIGALDKLPARSQEIFRLHKFEGLSYNEVANRLGVSRSAVEKHMMRALQRVLAVAPRVET